MSDRFERVAVRSRAEWREWLARHHTQAEAVWLVFGRRRDAPDHVPYEDLVEEALCYGWIDSTAKSLDDRRSMILMSARKPKSGWAATNKARVERLEAAGLMTDAGRAKVDAAKADGSWSALDAAERLEVPDDLARALKTRARATFDAWPPSLRKQAIYWITQAKRDATRAQRIVEIAEAAARGERPARWAR
ncbi:MAG TPA: YdeI/OmpD-associated family protein [Longimicrobiales bacterium]